MKNILSQYFESSVLMFNIPILHSELLVLEVTIRGISSELIDFARIIHRAMPYPVLLILNYKDEWFNVIVTSSHKHNNYEGREVIDNVSSSSWMSSLFCEGVLSEICKSITASITREEFFDISSNIIKDHRKKYSLLRSTISAYYPSFDNLVEQFDSTPNTIDSVFERLSIIIDMYYCTLSSVSSVTEDEENCFQLNESIHEELLRYFIDQLEEIGSEIHPYHFCCSEQDIYSIDEENIYDLLFDPSLDNEFQYRITIHNCAYLLENALTAYRDDLSAFALEDYVGQIEIESTIRLKELINKMIDV